MVWMSRVANLILEGVVTSRIDVMVNVMKRRRNVMRSSMAASRCGVITRMATVETSKSKSCWLSVTRRQSCTIP